MKYNQLKSNLTNKEIADETNLSQNYSRNKDERALQFRELKEIFAENKHPHFYKLKQTVSILHDKNFYKESFQKKNDTLVSSYHFDNVSNIKELDPKSLKAQFANCGLHVYDINLDSGLHNNVGKLNFKMRNNEEEKEVKMKVNQVHRSLKHFGVNLKNCKKDSM